MLVYGLNSLKRDMERINDLNVFPIPDGDTGDNMYSTLLGGVKVILDINDENLSNVASLVAKGMLLGARGNSGVILSQMFSGIMSAFEGEYRVDMQKLLDAFTQGVKTAYASVAQPIEGTMLTVIREATDYVKQRVTEEYSLKDFLTDYIKGTEISLDNTPNLLPVLKGAGVIDSGGAGVLSIMQGFLKFANGEADGDLTEIAVTASPQSLDFSLFNEDSVMEFGYCTEFLLQLTNVKTDIKKFSLEEMKNELATFGDSIVAVQNGSVIKVHVHTMTPGAVLSYAQGFGEFLTLKVENMTLQHSEQEKKEQVFKKNAVRKSFALITVANGNGLINLFKELGADLVIEGGQGRNPSVETFLSAFDAVNADNIFVLPNNNNIVMASREAGGIYKDANVVVVPTKTLGDGYAVLSELDYSSENAENIKENMLEVISCSKCVMVSQANKDTVADGVTINNGDYIGFENKKILCADADKMEALYGALDKVGANDYSFVVVFYGDKITNEEKSQLQYHIAKNYSNVEFYEIDGGQEVYDFVVVVE